MHTHTLTHTRSRRSLRTKYQRFELNFVQFSRCKLQHHVNGIDGIYIGIVTVNNVIFILELNENHAIFQYTTGYTL